MNELFPLNPGYQAPGAGFIAWSLETRRAPLAGVSSLAIKGAEGKRFTYRRTAGKAA
jgi:hypothetical protein